MTIRMSRKPREAPASTRAEVPSWLAIGFGRNGSVQSLHTSVQEPDAKMQASDMVETTTIETTE